MWFFSRKKRAREAEIQAIHKETLDTMDKTRASADRLNAILSNPKLGITEAIFYATGGDKRK